MSVTMPPICIIPLIVMAGLVPAIHDLGEKRPAPPVFMDGRDKPGHDVMDFELNGGDRFGG